VFLENIIAFGRTSTALSSEQKVETDDGDDCGDEIAGSVTRSEVEVETDDPEVRSTSSKYRSKISSSSSNRDGSDSGGGGLLFPRSPLPLACLCDTGTCILPILFEGSCCAGAAISNELVRLKIERPAVCPRADGIVIRRVSSGFASMGGVFISRDPFQED
jgi:hypothetical protein